ncbi:MAG: hypothetical protein ABJF10_11180 [Chthoniobacter sp.]|uniref:hypothetical protein n=1 Tax=Chthoniobacter sp. TaxID=2510640 RepID=UPI0032A94798
MKYTLLALSAACVFSGCAGAKIAHTDVATGAYNPKAIYIRSYIAEDAKFKGHHGDSIGEHPIRRSLAPVAFSKALKEEMEKMAPAMVLDNDESPTSGWLVESNLEYVHAGSQTLRALFGPLGLGHSCVKIHVRITDVNGHHIATSDKDMSKGGSGNVIYEFDVSGGSSISGPVGTTYTPGLGNPEEFDYKNAAERIYYALSIDPQRFGNRTTATINY